MLPRPLAVQAEARSVPNGAPINAWAANVTNNLIKKVVSEDAPFDLVVTNAVYFKGKGKAVVTRLGGH